MKYYFEKIKNMPIDVLITKTIARARKKISHKIAYIFDSYNTTYSLDYKFNSIPLFYNEILCESSYKQDIENIASLYCNHYFDLFGSGWVQVKYGMQCLGVDGYKYDGQVLGDISSAESFFEKRINKANFLETKRIRQLIDLDYQAIDWQLDFKSGYRWSENIWYMDMPYGHKPGVDIKVPWELARMQHLPMLALAYNSISDIKKNDKYLREFRNQVLDFIANNSPRYGVNWHCTMDVGIRVVNWLVAYDMFKTFGATFDAKFEYVFMRSVYEHGKHCYKNLEYNSDCRNNHYLSNIAGLLFVAIHLENNEETNRWLAFAVQELISEMEYEFYADGSNFEDSTSYHRLSTEIMLYCAMLCLTLSAEKKQALQSYNAKQHNIKPKLKSLVDQQYDINNSQILPDWFWERLEKACEFTMHITKPNGEIPQIGDNDSGRFLKIWPSYIKRTVAEAIAMYKNLDSYNELAPDATYWDENILDHSHILGVAGVLFNREDFSSYVENNPEVSLVRSMLQGKRIISYHDKHAKESTEEATQVKYSNNDKKHSTDWIGDLKSKYGDPIEYTFNCKGTKNKLTDGLVVYNYPDFGLYVYCSPLLYMAVRCGNIGKNGNAGHAHNDQLSIELTIDGIDIIRDPGTYVYTPLPERRNQFRSTIAHFTPQKSAKEQNSWGNGGRGLFSLTNTAHSKTIYVNIDGFIGMHSGFGIPVYRAVHILDNKIQVYDFGTNERYSINKIYSRGYGKWDR
jgi:hypothetical protein